MTNSNRYDVCKVIVEKASNNTAGNAIFIISTFSPSIKESENRFFFFDKKPINNKIKIGNNLLTNSNIKYLPLSQINLNFYEILTRYSTNYYTSIGVIIHMDCQTRFPLFLRQLPMTCL